MAKEQTTGNLSSGDTPSKTLRADNPTDAGSATPDGETADKTKAWEQFGKTPEEAVDKLLAQLQESERVKSEQVEQQEKFSRRIDDLERIIGQQGDELGRTRSREELERIADTAAEQLQEALRDGENPRKALMAIWNIVQEGVSQVKSDDLERRKIFGKVKPRRMEYQTITYDDMMLYVAEKGIDTSILKSSSQMERILTDISYQRNAITDWNAEREKIRKEERDKLEKEQRVAGSGQTATRVTPAGKTEPGGLPEPDDIIKRIAEAQGISVIG